MGFAFSFIKVITGKLRLHEKKTHVPSLDSPVFHYIYISAFNFPFFHWRLFFSSSRGKQNIIKNSACEILLFEGDQNQLFTSLFYFSVTPRLLAQGGMYCHNGGHITFGNVRNFHERWVETSTGHP